MNEKLESYYRMVIKWNVRLHLTTITERSEFWKLHIDESHFASTLLIDTATEIWDLGTGLGVPGIPLAIFRPDLEINLVELSRAKTIFLDEAAYALKLTNIKVHRKAIKTLPILPSNAVITARAVEKMEKLIPEFFRIGEEAKQMLLLVGKDLEPHVQEAALIRNRSIKSHLIPASQNRYIYEVLG